MTLKEAIKILETDHTKPVPFTVTDFDNALKILIKAGKREIANREDPDGPLCGLLPGETKD